ncbi:hypothetical protein AA12717_0292 [Gluconacetobacter sacchari DSM 12717]|uniref:Uncharacterized protein n=2 Tax=Gluconacetobacter sacchari TaxID=92759 RepID=A0A7W4IAP3_9PROT|nr:hypothetical protein [Gluconacetobacter sacchari]MBB2159378.1 hypothetical protein [Gluconacetobacter sacchari]GBQ19558.1 hypothetical protein AA12717_0292 [Gluconacetobacter sacchari DSM 12717]
MPKQAKKFDLTLTSAEAAEIHNPPVTSIGGRQQLERSLYRQLQATPNQISLDDKGLGKVLRYMSQYDGTNPPAGGGGLQGRLHRALSRPLREKLGL